MMILLEANIRTLFFSETGNAGRLYRYVAVVNVLVTKAKRYSFFAEEYRKYLPTLFS